MQENRVIRFDGILDAVDCENTCHRNKNAE